MSMSKCTIACRTEFGSSQTSYVATDSDGFFPVFVNLESEAHAFPSREDAESAIPIIEMAGGMDVTVFGGFYDHQTV